MIMKDFSIYLGRMSDKDFLKAKQGRPILPPTGLPRTEMSLSQRR
jgi:hypothetical protein